jgi:glycosyltransferase involved in cell wall biosynthesis
MSNFFFNCTTNIVGGGVKNSAIFIKYAIERSSLSWHFALSSEVKSLLDRWGVVVPEFTVFSESPARSIKARNRLAKLVRSCGADLVYTMAGPSYVSFSVPHVQGISNPHISHPNYSDLRSVIPLSKFIGYLLLTFYQRRKAKSADYFIFQTQSSLEGFCNQGGFDRKKAIVIPNAVDHEGFGVGSSLVSKRKSEKFKIFCPAAPYPHKALKFIPEYARKLLDLGVGNFIFVLSIPRDHRLYRSIMSDAGLLGVESKIETVGPYDYSNAAALYESFDAVFVPSLLETFSATYLEAFASKRVLVAANRQFAKDVCRDAAIYVEPHNPTDVAVNISYLINGSLDLHGLVEKGVGILMGCETQKSRADKIMDFLMSVSRKERDV